MPSRGNRSTLPHGSGLGQRGCRPAGRTRWPWLIAVIRVDLRTTIPARRPCVLRGFRPPDRCPFLPRGATGMNITGPCRKRQVGSSWGR